MGTKNQSKRLTTQHKQSKVVNSIFGEDAKLHDITISNISHTVMDYLCKEFPLLSFRYRSSIRKEEINQVGHGFNVVTFAFC